MLARLFQKEPPAAETPAASDVKPQQCTEKDRLRWEAMLFHWGADCESKLRSVRDIKPVFPPARPAPPA